MPEAYAIYEKQIKDVTVEEFETVEDTLKGLYGKDSEINKIYKKLSDLNEHKNNFGLVIQNTMVDNIIRVLELPEMAFSLLLPNGTYLTKPFSDELKDKIKEADGVFDFKTSTKPGVKDKGISPSKLREYDYHKDKLINNMAGKNILGLIVKEIPINNLLNKAGVFLKSSFVEEEVSVLIKDKQTGKVKKEVRNLRVPVELKLKHNYTSTTEVVNDVVKEVRRISMSNLVDADKKNLIADVLSQLTNGAVDIGKDDWVTYLQGNMEAMPKILFLLEAGVPAGDVFYFMNNPITRQYIKTIGKAKSKLAPILYKDRYMVNDFIKKYTDSLVGEILPVAKFAMNTAWGRNKLLNTYLTTYAINPFDKSTLRETSLKTINGADKNQMAGFLHYLYIEKLIPDHDALKDTVDVDTNPTGDNYEVQAKLEEIEQARNFKIYDETAISKIEKESSIASVFIQKFQAQLFGENFFSFRANAKLDEFIRNLLKDPQTRREILQKTGLRAENFPTKFKNALTLNIFNSALRTYDKNSNEYKKRPISELFNKDSYIKSINEVIEDYKNKTYLKTNTASNNYWTRGLYPIPEAATKELNLDEFIELSLEREYIRKHAYPYTEALKETLEFKFILNRMKKTAAQPYTSMTKEQLEKFTYEKFILDMALHNTYNNWSMFSSGNDTVATRLDNIIKNYPDLHYKYPKFIERFGFSTIQTQDNKNPRRNFKLVAKSEINKTMASSYNRQWKEIANPVMKLSGTEEKDYISNKYISDFFEQLPFFSFLQSGMDPSEFSMTNVMPNEEYTEVMTNASKKFTKEVLNTDKAYDALNSFLDLFLKNNSRKTASMYKGRGLSYKKNITDVQALKSFDNIDTSKFITNLNDNIYLLNDSYSEYGAKINITQNYINDFRANNPDVIYLLTDEDLNINLNATTPEEIAKVKVDITNKLDDIKDSGKTILIAADGFKAKSTQPTVQAGTNNPAEFTNYHGGADKYDTYWEQEGKSFGVTKHTTYTTSSYDALDQATKDKLEARYDAARTWLGRSSLSKDTNSGKLVRRDMMQAAKADGIFGISEIVAPGVKGRKGYVNKTNHPIVEGGTGYAVASGILLNKPVYVFNQDSKYGYETGWYKWDATKNNFVKTDIPNLTKNYAGIGSHTYETKIGKQAIRDVYAKTFAKPTTQATQKPISTEIKGTIQLELIEDLVQSGKAKTTVRRYDKPSGVYKSGKGNLYNIINKGVVKIVGNKIVGNNVSYTLDEFGAAEGFDNWENFKKIAKYAGQDLIQGKGVYLYDIKPVIQQKTSEDTNEGNTCNTPPF